MSTRVPLSISKAVTARMQGLHRVFGSVYDGHPTSQRSEQSPRTANAKEHAINGLSIVLSRKVDCDVGWRAANSSYSQLAP